MKSVLLVGSGGREHALALALRRSRKVGRIAYAGGENAGLEAIAERHEPSAVAQLAPGFDLTVIGPEAPLVEGLADRLRALGATVFGPGAAAAELEGSKAFTKEVCAAAGIPTARASVATSREGALAAVRAIGAPCVVKADGLAAGKGVTVAASLDEAERAVAALFDGAFGEAGTRVVVEERLEGPEVSLFALSDGRTVRPFATARDYKRAFDGDRGPNTGGMGAMSPAPGFSDEAHAAAMSTIVAPALAHLASLSAPYQGVLYAGLMLTAEGPKLIEFNVRFGDPECQVMWPLVRSDPFDLLYATASGTLDELPPIERSGDVALGVVVSAADYPASSAKGEPIGGLDALTAHEVMLVHAGTRRAGGTVVASGGRVLTVVGTAADIAGARARVYGALDALDWPGGRYRRDIGA